LDHACRDLSRLLDERNRLGRLIYTAFMPTPAAIAEYMKLSISERIQLVEDIWDSIAAEAPDTVALSQAQKAELHRRVAAHHADPSTAVPWEQVRSKLFPSKP
jgi:putative addiction module component (TIGR02574 family)